VIDLNDVAALRSVDQGQMLRRVGELPDQLRDGWQKAPGVSLPAEYRRVERLLVVGMGGSAIGAVLLRSLLMGQCRLPIIVHRDDVLPAWADEKTLVVASSYSGDTEETLHSFAQARQRGLPLVALTTNGRLAEEARRHNVPLLTFQYASPPRAALGYSFVSLLALLARLDLIPTPEPPLRETIGLLEAMRETLREDVAEEKNPAKGLARRLAGRLPIVFGGAPFEAVARRWKCQFNENSKTWAAWDELPEADHNTVVGTQFPTEVVARLTALFLIASHEDPRRASRRQVTMEVLAEAGIHCESLRAQGESLMAQIFSLVFLGDYVSCYLALLQGVDPTPIAAIQRLKARMSQRQSG
jgi:glucose/mannose-6-phosphate isomerase